MKKALASPQFRAPHRLDGGGAGQWSGAGWPCRLLRACALSEEAPYLLCDRFIWGVGKRLTHRVVARLTSGNARKALSTR